MQPQAAAHMEHPDICALSGVVAMGAIVIGGARYLTSIGNPSAIEDAKHTIYSAISGLLLALASWVIVSTINPDILVLKKPDMPWSAVGYDPLASTPQCALAGGPAGPESKTPCSCKDETDVLPKDPLPPVVVATVPVPCAEKVPSAAPAGAVVITYSPSSSDSC